MRKLELGSETHTFEILAHDYLGNCDNNNLVEVPWAIASDIVRCTPWTPWQWFCSLTIKWKFFLYYFAIHNSIRTKLRHRTRFIVVVVLGSTLFSVHHFDQSILALCNSLKNYVRFRVLVHFVGRSVLIRNIISKRESWNLGQRVTHSNS